VPTVSAHVIGTQTETLYVGEYNDLEPLHAREHIHARRQSESDLVFDWQ